MKLEDEQDIVLVHDRIGDIAKSIFCEWAEYQGLATGLPLSTKIEDITAAAPMTTLES